MLLPPTSHPCDEAASNSDIVDVETNAARTLGDECALLEGVVEQFMRYKAKSHIA